MRLNLTQILHLKLMWTLISLFLAIAFILLTYLPLILHGGIIVDDWGDIAHNLTCANFSDCYLSWFPLFSNRPLAPLPITTLTFLFETNFSAYLICNTAIYLAAIYLFASVIKKIVTYEAALIFFLLASIPMIAMPLVSSPINQSTATVSFLYWAISLWLLYQGTHKKLWVFFCASYLFLLFSFLTYEIILPLILINALLPWIILGDGQQKTTWFKYCIKFILPILVILLIVTLWQKGIAPRFMEVDSRLKFIPSHSLAKLHTWLHVFFMQIPSLFLKTKDFFTIYSLFTALILVFCLLSCQLSRPIPSIVNNSNWRFFLVCCLTLFASVFIFILSDESAVSWGYQARGLSSTWFTFALFLAAASSITKKLRFIYLIILIIFFFLSSLSFSAQRDGYIESWKIQKIIINDVLHKLNTQVTKPNLIVFGDVPKFLNLNYNDEIVFSQSWDFGDALRIYNPQLIASGAVIDSRKKDFHNLQFTNEYILLDGWWKNDANNMWFYDFDPISKQGKLFKIEDLAHLKKYLQFLGAPGALN